MKIKMQLYSSYDCINYLRLNMGCACKKKYEEISKKYGDGNEYKEEDGLLYKLHKILGIILAMIIFIPIIMVIGIPFLFVISIMSIIGKTPSFKLSKLMLFNKKR